MFCTKSRTDGGKHRHSRFICAAISHSRDRSIGRQRAAPAPLYRRIRRCRCRRRRLHLRPHRPTATDNAAVASRRQRRQHRFWCCLPPRSICSTTVVACCSALHPSPPLSLSPSFLPSLISSFFPPSASPPRYRRCRRRRSRSALGRLDVSREARSAIISYPSGLSAEFPPSLHPPIGSIYTERGSIVCMVHF